MDGSKTSVGQRKLTEKTRQRHVFARFEILALLARPAQ